MESRKNLLGLIGGATLGLLVALTPGRASANQMGYSEAKDFIEPRGASFYGYTFKPTDKIDIGNINLVPMTCYDCSLNGKPLDYGDLFFVEKDVKGDIYARSYFGAFRSDKGFDFKGEKTPNVPIPTPILLLGTGLVGMAGFRKRFKNNS